MLSPNALTKCKDGITTPKATDDDPTLELSTMRFTELLNLYTPLGGPSDNPDYLHWHLKMLPRKILEKIILLPRSLDEATKNSRDSEYLSGAQAKPVPLGRPGTKTSLPVVWWGVARCRIGVLV